MAKIHTLQIQNYKAFSSFKQQFYPQTYICLIGRGDSGKSTILEAIACLFCPSWNLQFYDTDFHNGDHSKDIVIEADIYDLPEDLLTDKKYGLHKTFLLADGSITNDIDKIGEEEEKVRDVLHLVLKVDTFLEPRWYIDSGREGQEPIEIRGSDRDRFGVFLISDYVDRHFSWSKGNPLNTLLRQTGGGGKEGAILEALRTAKTAIDGADFQHLEDTIQKVKDSSKALGVVADGVKTSVDMKDLHIQSGKVCLHDGKIPLRQKGKGTKRLVSVAIQNELARSGGILLVDEIEQGLEPDRVQHLVRWLRTAAEEENIQVLTTTHSRDVLVELSIENIYRVSSKEKNALNFSKELQGCIRKNPEAFFAKKVLVCEGLTEIGICRGIDKKRIEDGKEGAAYLGIRFADGTGSNLIEYSSNFNEAKYTTGLFCDSDIQANESKKEDLRTQGISIYDCEVGKSIEEQIFQDLPIESVRNLLTYTQVERSDLEGILNEAHKKEFSRELPADWNTNITSDIRKALGIAAKSGKGWYKSIDHGEYLGELCYSALEEIKETHLGKMIKELICWMEKKNE